MRDESPPKKQRLARSRTGPQRSISSTRVVLPMTETADLTDIGISPVVSIQTQLSSPVLDTETDVISSPLVSREPIYHASQVASICDVDLKTIHNWCEPSDTSETPQLECFRTPGGHLRFRHSAVLRFLFRWGYPIPDALLRDRPHMVIVDPDGENRSRYIETLGLLRPGEEGLVDSHTDKQQKSTVSRSQHTNTSPTQNSKSDTSQPSTTHSSVDLSPKSSDETQGLFSNARWYVHAWDDPYAALVAVGERTGAGAPLDLAVLSIPSKTLDVYAWVAAIRERHSTRHMRIVLVCEDERDVVISDPNVVGIVPRNRPDLLTALLDDQSVQIMASHNGGLPAPTNGRAAAASLNKKRRTPIAPREPIFVASQVAQIWDVDLKTVHNWVERGDIEAFSTPGRHLRFRRRSLLHFLRHYNMAIPEELAPRKPKVMVIDSDPRAAKRLSQSLGDLFDVSVCTDPVASLLDIGSQCAGANLIDAVVVTFPAPNINNRCWIHALRRHPDTRYTRIVVIAADDIPKHEWQEWQDLGAIATVQRHSLEHVGQVLERALGLEP